MISRTPSDSVTLAVPEGGGAVVVRGTSVLRVVMLSEGPQGECEDHPSVVVVGPAQRGWVAAAEPSRQLGLPVGGIEAGICCRGSPRPRLRGVRRRLWVH